MRSDWRFWSFLTLALTAAGCNGGIPSHANAAGDWTQSSTIPFFARNEPFGEADKHLAKKNCSPCGPIIDDFSGSPDGSKPESDVVATDGKVPNVSLVGTTISGGTSNNGTLYGLTEGSSGKWKESVLYSFGGSASGDGSAPVGIAMNFRQAPCCPTYVVTESGGTSGNGTFDGYDPNHDWKRAFTYSFGGTPDGANPIGNPVVDAAGNIYGSTESGGTYGLGTVYRMQPNGSLSYSETVLYSFDSSDGENPYGSLIVDRRDNLYGTTYVGGSAGEGTVFELTPSKKGGYTESVLHSFQGAPYDGSRVTAGPCGGPANAIYGTTEEGGTNDLGTVYKLTPTGSTYKETIIWNFGSVAGDGQYPIGGIVVNKKGVIYGTTLEGGAGGSSGLGTIFTLTPSGTGKYKETLFSFTGTNGAYPYSAPSTDQNKYMYFTISGGGTDNDGAVMRSSKPIAGSWVSSSWSGCT
jgi:uncharacterized repeat protein (TIGR03803 family)